MANTVRAFGFAPVQTVPASGFSGQIHPYYVPSSNTDAIYVGDPVKSAAGADTNGIQAVQKCASGDTPRGVVVGVYLFPPTSNPSLSGASLSPENTFVPATKVRGYYVAVADDPKTVFAIQDDGLAALTGSAANKNASYTIAAPSLPMAQLSATVLTTSSVATTQSLPLRVLGLKRSPADNAFGVNATWLVMFNQHELNGNTAGV